MELILENVLKEAAEKSASDIYLVSGKPLSMKLGGEIVELHENRLMPDDTFEYLKEIYRLASDRSIERVEEAGDDDFSFSLPGVARFRVSAFKQRGTLAAVIRVVAFDLPDPASLDIPQVALDQAHRKKGLVLVTGPTGSGKSTTLACMIAEINKSRNAHIITIEDPIEFLHRHNKSIVSQREVALDTKNYSVALRAALRQAPNVILLGELRDAETIDIAMTAAETGHLVLSTLHTVGSAKAVDRIVDAFPPAQQNQVKSQLATVLEGVVSQQLIPRMDKPGVILASEVMFTTPAIRNLVREGKHYQIASIIQTGQNLGMQLLEADLAKLHLSGVISQDDMTLHAQDQQLLQQFLRR